jgi:alkyl hydroperoxide reductase subunit F
MYDLIIIGGGPAGVAAGVYAARKMLKTLFITETFGGQSTDSMGIQNWIGTISIAGPALGMALESHLKAYAPGIVDIVTGVRATKVSKEADTFTVTTSKDSYTAKAVLVASGSYRRKLDIPGAKEYENKGITYCASCDGPLFSGQDVVVIGGGNAGFETAAQLLAYTKSVTLLNRTDRYKADEATVKTVLEHPNMKGILNAETTRIEGDKFVKSLTYKDLASGEEHTINTTGIFVEIGLVPNTALVEGLMELNQYRQIVTDPRTQRTSVSGLWAAGDCTDALFHQNNIAAGDAVKALEDIYLFLRAGGK